MIKGIIHVGSRAGTKHRVELVGEDGGVIEIAGVGRVDIVIEPGRLPVLRMELIHFTQDIRDVRSKLIDATGLNEGALNLRAVDG